MWLRSHALVLEAMPGTLTTPNHLPEARILVMVDLGIRGCDLLSEDLQDYPTRKVRGRRAVTAGAEVQLDGHAAILFRCLRGRHGDAEVSVAREYQSGVHIPARVYEYYDLK